MKKTTLLLVSIILFTNLWCQKFEGTINFSLEYDLPEIMEQQRSMLPKDMVTYCKKDFSRVEQKTAMGDQIVITNSKTGASTLLLNMMGQKMAIQINAEDDINTSTNKPSINYINESKTIAGYKCDRATYTVFDEQQQDSVQVDVFYTDKIAASYNAQFKYLAGFPLEYTINTNGMAVTFLAKDISDEKLSNKLFIVPDDYEKLTLEDFKKMMGQ